MLKLHWNTAVHARVKSRTARMITQGRLSFRFCCFLTVSLWSRGTIHHRRSNMWIGTGIRDYMLIFIFSDRFFRSKVDLYRWSWGSARNLNFNSLFRTNIHKCDVKRPWSGIKIRRISDNVIDSVVAIWYNGCFAKVNKYAWFRLNILINRFYTVELSIHLWRNGKLWTNTKYKKT